MKQSVSQLEKNDTLQIKPKTQKSNEKDTKDQKSSWSKHAKYEQSYPFFLDLSTNQLEEIIQQIRESLQLNLLQQAHVKKQKSFKNKFTREFEKNYDHCEGIKKNLREMKNEFNENETSNGEGSGTVLAAPPTKFLKSEIQSDGEDGENSRDDGNLDYDSYDFADFRNSQYMHHQHLQQQHQKHSHHAKYRRSDDALNYCQSGSRKSFENSFKSKLSTMQLQHQLSIQQQELIQQLQLVQRQYLMHQGMALQQPLSAAAVAAQAGYPKPLQLDFQTQMHRVMSPLHHMAAAAAAHHNNNNSSSHYDHNQQTHHQQHSHQQNEQSPTILQQHIESPDAGNRASGSTTGSDIHNNNNNLDSTENLNDSRKREDLSLQSQPPPPLSAPPTATAQHLNEKLQELESGEPSLSNGMSVSWRPGDRSQSHQPPQSGIGGIIDAIGGLNSTLASHLIDDYNTEKYYHPLYAHGMCRWPGCELVIDDVPTFVK